ncbi:AAA family ATPase [Paracoccus sp. PARArs4]|uniref:ATP-dependent DNA helicase n=1 Tax=Paracoccus sp. PARArs4 TaxID=2853442 RepID=UPI0024A6F042|nr:AAA family ATPase [Paracoccus sp. PARArs4]
MASASPTLSIEQNSAVQGIITKEIKILVGGAGTGKSTAIKAVYDELGDNLCVVAPTHIAAANLENAGIPRVYQVVALIQTTKNSLSNQLIERGVTHVIVDEASMLTRRQKMIIDDTCALAGIHVTYVGDSRQLPPITGLKEDYKQNWFLNEVPDFVLTENFRQESGVDPRLVRDCAIEADATHICMTNEMRNQLNVACHEVRYGNAAYADKNKTILNLHEGQFLLANFTSNPYRDSKTGQTKITYRNNALYEIESVSRTRFHFYIKFKGIKKSVQVAKKEFSLQALESNAKRQFDFSYAITCHSAQGMGFDNVYVHLECVAIDKGKFNQWDYALPQIAIENWLYTAMTRGKKSITVVDKTGAVERDGLSLSINADDFGKQAVTVVQEPSKTVPAFAVVEVVPAHAEESPAAEAAPAPKPVAVEQDDEAFMKWFFASGTAKAIEPSADELRAKREQQERDEAEYYQFFKVYFLAQRRAMLAAKELQAA